MGDQKEHLHMADGKALCVGNRKEDLHMADGKALWATGTQLGVGIGVVESSRDGEQPLSATIKESSSLVM